MPAISGGSSDEEPGPPEGGPFYAPREDDVLDRSALFVDAGYLFAAGGQLCLGTRARHRITLDAEGLNALLVDLAARRCGLPVLRTYWYDGARDGIATPSQQMIASLANVKLRLGRLNVKNEQKGVDALIYRDLMTLARERAICEAFLLSGDEDLREGVHAAQDQGVRVTVVGIRAAAQDYNQSKELLAEADEVTQLNREDLRAFFRLTAAPSLSAASVEVTPSDAGRSFAETWLRSATDSERAALLAQRPRIPRPLDSELLRSAEDLLGISLRGQDALHRELRRTFWRAVAEAAQEE